MTKSIVIIKVKEKKERRRGMMNYIVEFQKRNQYDCDGNSKPCTIAKCFDENTTLKEIVNWVINECGWLDWHAKDYIGATYGPAPQYESYHLIYDLKEYMEGLENGKA